MLLVDAELTVALATVAAAVVTADDVLADSGDDGGSEFGAGVVVGLYRAVLFV